jgi:histone deacetylase 1/2
LAHASVPFRFWSDAFSTACFLINRTPTRVLDMKTPLELLLNELPDYTFFKVFGCACWPHLRPYNKHKLEYRSKNVFFLAIVLFTKGTNAFMFPRIVSTYLGMLFSMRILFLFQASQCPL